MNKPILFAMLAVAGSLVAVSDVEARCCRRKCCPAPTCGCAATPAWNGCGAAQATTDMPQPAAANGSNSGSSYQSYSYEPGVNQATAAPVTVMRSSRPGWSEYNNVLRGNRKVVNPAY